MSFVSRTSTFTLTLLLDTMPVLSIDQIINIIRPDSNICVFNFTMFCFAFFGPD